VSRESLQFPASEELVKTILSATDLMESEAYRQSTEYLFCRRGDILLEKAYFGVSDCIAVGSGSLGLINGYKYKNRRYSHYLKSDTPSILSMRKLTDDELERVPIVGFPRLLRMPKGILSDQMKLRYREKLRKLIDLRLLEETRDEYLLTAQGRAFINNIYFMMMEKEEQQEVQEKLKILELE
jgi:coproporphyrinogen III oxidase-like Fe-S oxidoreductase